MQWVRPMECVEAAHAVRRNMPWQTPRISYAVTDYPLEDYGTGLVAAQTVRFLEQHGNEPFALSVSFPDPHEPYEAPRHYAEMFPPEHIELPPWRANEFDDRAPERNRVLHQMLGMETDPEDEVRKMVGIYYAMVRFLDDGIGQILDALERLRLRDNTIVVFTADHGDFMGLVLPMRWAQVGVDQFAIDVNLKPVGGQCFGERFVAGPKAVVVPQGVVDLGGVHGDAVLLTGGDGFGQQVVVTGQRHDRH